MNKRSNGFTLLELMIAITIIALTSAIALPAYTSFVDRSNDSEALAQILEIQMAIDRFNANTFAYPDSLAELPGVPATDPWGNAYSYLRIDGNTTPGIKGKQRKDKNLNPLNTDFDLFSMGKDGDTKGPLTAKASRDDLVRAGNGGFVGKAEDH